MDPSRALLALDELAKWRERKLRVEERLRAVRAQKQSMLLELETVRARIAQLGDQLAVRAGPPAVRQPVQPAQPGVLR